MEINYYQPFGNARNSLEAAMHGSVNTLRDQFHKLFEPPADNGTAAVKHKTLDFVEHLSSGGKAVIVGGLQKDYCDELRRHPQFVVWSEVGDRARELPANARIVVTNKYTNHGFVEGVRSQVRRRHGVFSPPGIYTSSQINEAFHKFEEARALTVTANAAKPAPRAETKEQTVPATATAAASVPDLPVDDRKATTQLRKLRRGELKEFVMAHCEPGPGPNAESVRLLAKLADLGIESTRDSVRQAIRMYVGQTATRIAPAVPPPPAVAVRAPTAHKVRPAADLLQEAVAEAEKCVADIRTASDLLAELLPRIQHDLERFREQQRKVREVAQQASEFLD